MDMSWVEIDRKAILHNIKEARRKLSRGVKICAIIKDNAYGHGLIPVARALEKGGVECLGIGDISEAVALRSSGIDLPILNIVSAFPFQARDIVSGRISQSVSGLDIVKALDKEAKKQRMTAKIHIEIDTGMGRLGIPSGDFENFYKKVSEFKNVKVEGVFTHLASSDVNPGYTWKQISDFEYSSFFVSGGVLKHVLNSSGVIYFSGAGFDMARPGLMIYGLHNNKEENKTVNLKPALSWKTKVLLVKCYKKGSNISYGNTYKTKRDTKIAVLGIGYGSGYNRLLSNNGEVLINGNKYPVTGRVCMDLTMVELGNNSKVKAGDTAFLIGRSKNKVISAEEVAEKCKTIPYEIVCAINKDIKRVYV